MPGLKVRRSQISAVFHTVRRAPIVPKAPGPLLHAVSLKAEVNQLLAGVVVVYFHVCPAICELGIRAGTVMAVPAWAIADRIRSASDLRTCRS